MIFWLYLTKAVKKKQEKKVGYCSDFLKNIYLLNIITRVFYWSISDEIKTLKISANTNTLQKFYIKNTVKY